MSHPSQRGRGGRRPAQNRNMAAMTTPNDTPQTSGTSTPLYQPPTGPRFADIQGVHPDILRLLPFEHATEVQAATLPSAVAGHDILAQAKTGTGKTLAFLIPSVQRLLTSPPRDGISILVLSPTRELAQQIKVAAEGLLRTSRNHGVQCVVGGTNMQTDIKNFVHKRSDILVATPGRLMDLLENGGLGPKLSQLQTLVLDEADRLLDQGFRKELLTILGHLPNKQTTPRQTLLFSATIPDEVHKIASLALDKSHKFISTLKEEDINTHEHVIQESLVVPADSIIAATLDVLQREKRLSAERGGFKVMAFLPTARAAAIYHDIFQNITSLGAPVWEIHSRMSQSARTKATEAFRATPTGILFSSDVTARGIDVKGVTAVLQIGLPSSAEQYIHRLGRTARAGAEGHGILILGDFESHFLRDRTIASLKLQPYPTSSLVDSQALVADALRQVPSEAKEQSYQAWIGYYNSNLRVLKWSKADLVRYANEYAMVSLLYTGEGGKPPPLQAKTVGKMGLKGVQGLNVVRGDSGGMKRPIQNASRPESRQAGSGGQNGASSTPMRDGASGAGKRRRGSSNVRGGRGGSRPRPTEHAV